jgi:hypothetical protein
VLELRTEWDIRGQAAAFVTEEVPHAIAARRLARLSRAETEGVVR